MRSSYRWRILAGLSPSTARCCFPFRETASRGITSRNAARDLRLKGSAVNKERPTITRRAFFSRGWGSAFHDDPIGDDKRSIDAGSRLRPETDSQTVVERQVNALRDQCAGDVPGRKQRTCRHGVERRGNSPAVHQRQRCPEYLLKLVRPVRA